ncbi:MAG: DivIVA domain-containing protein [Acholeplasma sp.]|nr:DivIVA domain-containing protein [Acholeplasma sp.]
MNKRIMTNIQGSNLDCEIIRYFEKNNNKYLIYSLNEMDEVGYVKLYASKIVDKHARIITDDDEWTFIKETIKDIVRNNRDGVSLDIIDLNENELENIVLEDNRIFKLQGNLVNLLMENKKVVSNDIYEEEAVNSEDVLIKDDYETLYKEMVTKNELLEQRINMLEEELKIYKQKLESIDDIIHS